MNKRILVFGIGNPGRCDDGLGPAFVDALTRAVFPDVGQVTAEVRYQLNIEDAAAVRDFDIVVFADAAKTGTAPVTLEKIEPSDTIAFTAHTLAPTSVLALCAELYGGAPEAYVLAIRGDEFDIGEGLSPQAERNLASALEIFISFIQGVP